MLFSIQLLTSVLFLCRWYRPTFRRRKRHRFVAPRSLDTSSTSTTSDVVKKSGHIWSITTKNIWNTFIHCFLRVFYTLAEIKTPEASRCVNDLAGVKKYNFHPKNNPEKKISADTTEIPTNPLLPPPTSNSKCSLGPLRDITVSALGDKPVGQKMKRRKKFVVPRSKLPVQTLGNNATPYQPSVITQKKDEVFCYEVLYHKYTKAKKKKYFDGVLLLRTGKKTVSISFIGTWKSLFLNDLFRYAVNCRKGVVGYGR